ncbi:protein FAR1-RELATED SEQUENCE 5-like [Cynara cardunculus var. scolymus]|uniref:protein FAR1-RELATED SEQUENCE 5-like n=1 Tax=Cynara cardunculus var. scolymus TaxID=59895 RepID=UPI000D630603|nr:protein FAR1-RELATED SEQUENCE 5-like [Cynara cardunculus var. scolymus]
MTVVDMLNIVGFYDLTPPHPEFDYDIGESSERSKYFIPIVDDALKPKTNAQYASLNDAEKMYRAYVDKAGFDVRVHAKKTNKHGDIQNRWFVCSKEGNPNKRQFNSLEIQPSERRYRNTNLKRCGCNACLKIHLTKDGGCYEIYEFVDAHNHSLFNVNDRRFSRKNIQMKYTNFETVLNSSSYKVDARRTHRIQTSLNGGFEHTRVSEVDFKNFKRDVVACVENKDAKMLINKLSNRRDIVPGYFFEYKCNEQELIAIFWADEVVRINYKEFGDVISFDGTFRTNKHAMIFVPFLAVDNHKASVVVGSALISGETIKNFTWVLKAFLKCHEKQPVFVITDQCSAMKQAIPMVFTEAKHRLLVVIYTQVSVVLNQDPIFNKVINKLVWNIHIGPAEFERRWHEMIDQYNLGGDPWFTEMYAIRHLWIPAFYKDTPMSEKQRYRKYVHETVTRTTNPKFVTPLHLESYASRIYSRNVFFDIQKEIKKAVWFCAIETVECRDDLKSFVISHKTKKSSETITYLVNRNYSTDTIECECHLFTRNGYLCRHAFKVLINDEVEFIPDRYVLRRWKRQLVPVQIQSARVRYDVVDAEKDKCIVDVYSKVDEIISITRNDKSILARLERNLDKFIVDIEKEVPYEDPSQQKLDAIREHLGVSIPDEVDILPPSGIRNKGCDTGKRLVSVSEKIQTNSKKAKRKCAICGQRSGHDSRNCPELLD